jgi:enterochelin esterase family protein
LVPVLIYLPPCYDDLNRRYPVLYLLHGKPQDEKHWQILGVEAELENAYMDGTLPPLLVVMPRQPEPLFSGTDGGPGSYEDEFINGLVPFIDRTYRTIAQGDSRGLAGVSRGGVWALEIGFRNSDTIQRIGALSPALNVNYARPEYDPFSLMLYGELPSTIFLMSGDTDYAAKKTLELSEALREAEIEHKYLSVSGNHESSTWRGVLPELLQYLTVDW